MSDVTIHIDETLDSSTIQEIQQDLSRVAGIDKINSQERNPHLMVIEYDRKMMSSSSILSTFTSQGLHAELIGF
ncbi:MAG: ATP-binding protein [Gammaproteobacteria bacterium]|jgi:hypothetical protein|nr:ATP-binding protein [Gammaproteobacteria bacterium]MBT3724584.1 ATP-binding protein [Gammaproteobacteria bacterium]MBT4075965.1 ATP-binding protein [Gammaproteobacteria bacterium]MBT4193366.1 ATP-binding protein [Gammaproteobacteria bacterium]MBT4451030.1 ATP-binding protein [Gammaproteobacteria bacterium]